MKRPTIVCIFAHPDDESFGPAGTIAQLSRKNNVYVLCATKGEVGKNYLPVSEKTTAQIREQELIDASKVLGVKEVFFLGFEDGTLCNNLYHKLADKIQYKLEELKPETIMTFEPHGVSGHIDHITVSMVSSFVFWKLPFIKTMWQVCLTKAQTKERRDYFVYFPEGYKKSEIGKVVNTTKEWKLKQKAMRIHRSQIDDVEKSIKRMEKFPKQEYFLVVNK